MVTRDFKSGQIVAEFEDHRLGVRCLAWSHDGSRLASSGSDGRIVIRSTAENKVLRTITAHRNTVYDLTWSKDDRLLASASFDRTAAVWKT